MPDSPLPSYSFHGSNSSHSKDNGKGGRTYHIPNYATRSVVTSQSNRPVRVNAANSYANDRSKLISIKFDEDKRTPRAIITVVLIFLLFAAVSLFVLPLHFAQVGPAMTSLDHSQPPVHTSERAQDFDSSSRTGATCIPGEANCSTGSDAAEQATIKGFSPAQVREGAYWGEPKPSKRCSGFGAREYHARLWNLSFFSDWTAACKGTGIEIHGVVFPKPTRCESRWPFGGVIGHWVVNLKEEDCIAHWSKVVDKGCIESGKKRFQSRLRGVKNREDRMSLCLTAPAVIQGKKIIRPTSCTDQGIWGIYGLWDLDDRSC